MAKKQTNIENTETADTVEAEPQTSGKIDARVKARWVAALESGEYVQAQGVLQGFATNKNGKATKKIGNCCLGVLCTLFSRSKANVGKLKWVEQMTDVYDDKKEDYVEKGSGEFTFDDDESMPPTDVAEWAGFGDEDGTTITDPWVNIKLIRNDKKVGRKYDAAVKAHKLTAGGSSYDGKVTLSELNDSGKFDFAAIAHVIKTYL